MKWAHEPPDSIPTLQANKPRLQRCCHLPISYCHLMVCKRSKDYKIHSFILLNSISSMPALDPLLHLDHSMMNEKFSGLGLPWPRVLWVDCEVLVIFKAQSGPCLGLGQHRVQSWFSRSDPSVKWAHHGLPLIGMSRGGSHEPSHRCPKLHNKAPRCQWVLAERCVCSRLYFLGGWTVSGLGNSRP